jgi:hypothetical protein
MHRTSHRATLRLIRETGLSEWYGIVNAAVLGVSLALIVAEGITAHTLGLPLWGWAIIGNATLLLAFYRVVRNLHRRVATQPLDAQHEAHLRSLLPKFGTVNWEFPIDQMKYEDFKAHVPRCELWEYHDEWSNLNTRLTAARRDYDARLTARLRDGLGLPFRVVAAISQDFTNRLGRRQQDQPDTPWDLTHDVSGGGDGRLLINGTFVGGSTTSEEFSALEREIPRLWDEVLTWDVVKEMMALPTQLGQLQFLIGVHRADLTLSNLAGTGPCDHC